MIFGVLHLTIQQQMLTLLLENLFAQRKCQRKYEYELSENSSDMADYSVCNSDCFLCAGGNVQTQDRR